MIQQDTNKKQTIECPSQPLQLIQLIYNNYFQTVAFQEIDFIIGQASDILSKADDQCSKNYVCIIDKCLLYTEKAYDVLYGFLIKSIIDQNVDFKFKNKCADILVTMNGQNDKVYNFKKKTLLTMAQLLKQKTIEQISQSENHLLIQKQLLINSAVIMKFKKTTSCYQYRLKLYQFLLTCCNKNQNQFLCKVIKQQNDLQIRVLDRFPRNYFCWMFRLRLFKLITTLNNDQNIYQKQVQNVIAMLEKSPNDYSAISYIMFLLRWLENKQKFNLLFKYIQLKCSKLQDFCKNAYQSSDKYMRLTQLNKYLIQKQNNMQINSINNNLM